MLLPETPEQFPPYVYQWRGLQKHFSKIVTQGKLHNARTTRSASQLPERCLGVETEIDALVALCVWPSIKVRCVGHVVGFPPELKSVILAQAERSLKADIQIEISWAMQGAAASRKPRSRMLE